MKKPDEAAEYLRCSLDEYFRDGDTEALLTAIRTVAEAQGDMTQSSEHIDSARQRLYKNLAEKGSPGIGALRSVLNSLGFRLSIEPIPAGGQ